MTEFTWDINTEITAADIPELTEGIIFGDTFDKPIGPNILPNSLELIAFGYKFNQEIGESVLPKSLKSIDFGWKFDRTIGEMFCLIPWKKSILVMILIN